jgi:tetratricopeptide (TPR) repeat protein
MDDLSKRLLDDDADVRRLTEKAMWRVWFRSGNEKADGLLQASMESIQKHRFDQAIQTLEAALEIDPDFAEAYNQRAIVHYFRHQYAESIRDCQEVIKRNPYHFGALSGMGQCYQHLHRPDEAIKVYERALRVNPNMEGVRKTLIRLLDADGQAIQA